MPDSAEAWRRWLGLFAWPSRRACSSGGQTILKPHLDGLLFIIYWASVLVSRSRDLIALLDVRAVRRRIRRSTPSLARTLQEIEEQKDRKDGEEKE
jgi:hypothetical protein